MKVAGYIRVSTEMQKEEGSHERQRKRMKEWADREGHDLDLYEDIAISGQSEDREAYQELMDSLEEYDAVAVREMSRFGRSLQRVLEDIEKLDEEDVEFISLKEDFDTSSAMGKAMMQMIGVFNEFWANLARERTIEMQERRKREGKTVGRPKKLDKEEREKLLERREKGVSYNALAQLHNISPATARRYCQEEEEKEDV